jgi:hypothetical protein
VTAAKLDRPRPAIRKGERATEAACQATVVKWARILGYRVLAIRPASGGRRGGGFASPIQGDAGYPDLTLAHPRAGVLFVELKRRPNNLEPAQQEWRAALEAAGATWLLWWVPEELDELNADLAARARP